jgi:colicin import membrane protein
VGATSPTGDPAKRKINLSVAPKGSVMSDVGSARCPVCGTPTTQTQQAIIEERLREIQDGARTEEQAKLCAQHEAELKKATAEAAAKARQEVEQKLAQALIKEMRQADRIRQLETNQATLQAEATKAQQQLQAQFEKDLKAATEKAAVDARRDVEQTLAQAHIKETEQADRIHQLETNETALRAEAAKALQHLQAKFEKDLSAATETAANDARARRRAEARGRSAQRETTGRTDLQAGGRRGNAAGQRVTRAGTVCQRPEGGRREGHEGRTGSGRQRA